MLSKESVRPVVTLALLLTFCFTASAFADGGITYRNLADHPRSGLDWERAPSEDFAVWESQLQSGLAAMEVPLIPHNPEGQTGVAIFDYDDDGDLDLFVTNGPGKANSLFSNQLMEWGRVRFRDVGRRAGVAATDMDASGVCYGDLDNDGDDDLFVLGRATPNRLFENRGNGSFRVVEGSGLEGGFRDSSSCTMGDIDGDGLLDVLIGNPFDQSSNVGCMVEPWALTQHNQLFSNRGDLRFDDVSESSGILDLVGFPEEAGRAAGITWAVSMVDLDHDADLDLVFADDQCALPGTAGGGVDRGFLHLMINDGSGHFEDHPILDTPNATGSWMGLGFGDLDCDGNLDIFGSNVGDYFLPTLGAPYLNGQQASRVLYGNGDGSFRDPGVGSLGASVFGWGNAVYDADNDGDLDIAYQGGLETVITGVDNPGVLLINEGCGENFYYDDQAFSVDHLRRGVQAVAMGDLDRNGFVDLVTASSFNVPEGVPMLPAAASYGSVFDETALFIPFFTPTEDGVEWSGYELAPGDLVVELASRNGNRSVTVELMGGVGLVRGGRVNRSAIGAVVSFTPDGGKTVAVPVQGGSSFSAQHTLEQTFGFGGARVGTLEVIWPGGVRNRLENVRPGQIVMPEIPCSLDADWPSFAEYRSCVQRALTDLQGAGVIDAELSRRLRRSALRDADGRP